MAVKAKKDKTIKAEPKQEVKQEEKFECCDCCDCRPSRWQSAGWVLLLAGGLAHMLPEQMAPVLKWSLLGVSLQMAIGVVSVILALNFLLED